MSKVVFFPTPTPEGYEEIPVACVECGYDWLAIVELPIPNVLACPDCDRAARGEPRFKVIQ